jgi:hypothetical protein
MPTASILIPHYNNPEILRPCLESLRSLAPDSPAHEVVVVDDGSTDDSVAWVRREHPWALVVECGENGGFVRAIQTGVEASESEILVFLNNDTWVEPGWLEALVDPLVMGKVSGSTGSILMDWEGTSALFRGVTANHLGYGFEIRGDLPDPSEAPIPVLCACGGAMAISRKLYLEAGGFDLSFGMIYEDLDLGWRLNLLGYDCCLIPGSRAGHKAHTSLGRSSFERKARYYLLNPIRMLFKNVDPEDHLERIQMAVTLAQARERICLLGETRKPGFFEGLGSFFSRPPSTPLVDSMVREEERTRELAKKRTEIQARRKRTSREIFDRFVPEPRRPWYFDEEQREILEKAGYWDLEKRTYRRYGLV